MKINRLKTCRKSLYSCVFIESIKEFKVFLFENSDF